MIRKFVLGGAAVLAVGGTIWGVAGQDHTKRDSLGAVVTSGQLGVFVIHLGDCFESLPDKVTTIATLQAVPCSSPHHWQDYFKGTLTDSTYDPVAITAESRKICNEEASKLVQSWTATIANEYQSAFETFFSPTPESWAKGDRALDCLTGSKVISFSDSVLS